MQFPIGRKLEQSLHHSMTEASLGARAAEGRPRYATSQSVPSSSDLGLRYCALTRTRRTNRLQWASLRRVRRIIALMLLAKHHRTARNHHGFQRTPTRLMKRDLNESLPTPAEAHKGQRKEN